MRRRHHDQTDKPDECAGHPLRRAICGDLVQYPHHDCSFMHNGCRADGAFCPNAGGASALAQESGDNAQTQEAEDTAPAEQAATPAETGETPAKETGPQTRSPFDYRASEQISEDLSVSFPVDI